MKKLNMKSADYNTRGIVKGIFYTNWMEARHNVVQIFKQKTSKIFKRFIEKESSKTGSSTE